MLLACPNCSTAVPKWLLKRARSETLCPKCNASFSIELFPARFRDCNTSDSGASAAEGEACCYEHPNKRAVSLCSHCGRFVCALCELEIAGATWCPACMQSGATNNAVPVLETQRTLYDSIALALATWPAMLLFYPSIITAPLTLFVAIRYWKSPSSLIPRNKWRLMVAVPLALAEVGLLVTFVIALLMMQRRGGG